MKIKTICASTLLLLIASFAMAQIPCGPTIQPAATLFVNWPQLRYDHQHTGCNPYETALGTATVGGLVLDWTYATAAPVYGDPAVVNGVVYFTSKNYPDAGLYAVNATTGALLWSYAPDNGIRWEPTFANGVVYIGQSTPNAGIYALNAATGVVLWHYPTTYGSSPVNIVNGVLYAGDDNGIVALDPGTGKVLWRYNIDGAVQAPAVDNGVLFFNSIKFTYPNTYVNILWALNAATQQVIWQQTWTGTGAIYQLPIVGNGKVFFNSAAFDEKTGTMLWKSPNYFVSTPSLAKGVLYFGGCCGIFAENANTGEELWFYGNGAFVDPSPSIANGVVYIGADDGNFYALNASTGALLWSDKISSGKASSAAVANGKVYVGSQDKRLYVFHLPGQ